MTDAAEERKAQLVAAHRAVFDDVLSIVSGLDPEAFATPTGCPGWDVRDQLSHVIGLERDLLGDPGDDVEVPEFDHVRSATGRHLEIAVHARRARPVDELVTEAEETFARRIEALEALDPDALERDMDGPGTMRMRGASLLRQRIFDITTHAHDMRRALGMQGGSRGPHIDVTVELVLRVWSRLLPERLDGGLLGIGIAGGPVVVIDLEDGRRVEDATPHATVSFDVDSLLAIAGGRSDAPSTLPVDGDEVLAMRFIEAAAFTP